MAVECIGDITSYFRRGDIRLRDVSNYDESIHTKKEFDFDPRQDYLILKGDYKECPICEKEKCIDVLDLYNHCYMCCCCGSWFQNTGEELKLIFDGRPEEEDVQETLEGWWQ